MLILFPGTTHMQKHGYNELLTHMQGSVNFTHQLICLWIKMLKKLLANITRKHKMSHGNTVSHTPTPSEVSPNSHPGQHPGRSVISEVSGVDWTRLMGDICPGCLSIRVKDYRMRCQHCDKTAPTHTHIQGAGRERTINTSYSHHSADSMV